jgi:hypothetical protein
VDTTTIKGREKKKRESKGLLAGNIPRHVILSVKKPGTKLRNNNNFLLFYGHEMNHMDRSLDAMMVLAGEMLTVDVRVTVMIEMLVALQRVQLAKERAQ